MYDLTTPKGLSWATFLVKLSFEKLIYLYLVSKYAVNNCLIYFPFVSKESS